MNQTQVALAEAKELFIAAARKFLERDSQDNVDEMIDANQALEKAEANLKVDEPQDFDQRTAIVAIANKLAAQERVIQTLVQRFNAVVQALSGGESENAKS